MANSNPSPLTPEALQRLHEKILARNRSNKRAPVVEEPLPPAPRVQFATAITPPRNPEPQTPPLHTLVLGEDDVYMQASPPDASPPSTPPGQKRPPPPQLTPAERAERSAKRLAKIQTAVDDPFHPGGAAAPPIPAPNWGSSPKSQSPKKVPSPTEESGAPPPTTKRTPSFPSLGDSEEYKFIGFDPQVQALMNRYRLPWAVQYEISRYRSQLKAYCFTIEEYDEIFDKLCKRNLASRLQNNQPDGSNTEARQIFHLVRSVVRKNRTTNDGAVKEADLDAMELKVDASQIEMKDPYLALDAEEKAIISGSGAGLGLSPGCPEGPEWYGGQVAQTAVLVEHKKKRKNPLMPAKPDEDPFTLVLMKHKIASSTRVARMFGSRRVIQCTIPGSVVKSRGEPLRKFFHGKKFVLNGRVFEAICAKDGTVYLLETGDYNEGLGDMRLPTLNHISNNGRKTLLEFFDWHNPIHLNSHQTISKWSARFSLSLSRSVPACRFLPTHVCEIPDLRNVWDGPDRQLMTDGCGFMNKQVALRIQRLLDLKYLPSAIQARIGGVKGMFILHPSESENASNEPKVWCRPSQIKIRHGSHTFVTSADSQLTLDLLRYAHPKMPAHLSKEVIACLGFGGVTDSVLERLFLEALDKQFQQLANWEGRDALVKLWRAIFDLEHVLEGRLRRETAGASRAWGYGEALDNMELDLTLESDDEDDVSDASLASGPEQASGLPASLAEQVLAFLAAGFHPNSTPVLKQKLDRLITKIVKDYVEKYRVAVERSVEGFAVPDPLGILEEGEVYFHGTSQWQNKDGSWTDTVVGDVLATRHPCKVASDVQKFHAVDRPELREWSDVIIFSTKGSRSPLSLLGGGDYDGDTVILIFESDIVDSFHNAPLSPDGLCQGDPEPGFVEKYFNKRGERLDDFLRDHADEGELIQELQEYLLGPLVNERVVGAYSNFHQIATLEFGYDSPEAIILAQKFCHSLDGVKAGITIQRSVFGEDSRLFNSIKLPASRGGAEGFTTQPWMTSPRKKIYAEHDIIEKLWIKGQEKAKEYRDILVHRKGNMFNDPILREPYESARARAKALIDSGYGKAIADDIEDIEAAVDITRREYDERTGQKKYPLKELKWAEVREVINACATELRATLEAISLRAMSVQEMEKVAASYAYVMDMTRYNAEHFRYENKGTEFPFNIMFRELADIKARSRPHSVTVTEEFATRFVVHSSFLRKH